MRAFGWSWAASLALSACAAPPPLEPVVERHASPQRVVSLNLCTDELLLLLARPEQIASVSHLAAREEETPLHRQASRYPANDGTMTNALSHRPDLVLTMGGGGDRLSIARRLGVASVDLPYPQTLDDIVRSIRAVAQAVHRPPEGERLVEQIAALQRSIPARQTDTLWVGSGGRTASATGLEAQWMALAGLRQRAVVGDQLELETFLLRTPDVILRSDYRAGQYSRAQAWLSHPLARRRGVSRNLTADGRRWTCLGPTLIDEVARLRAELAA